MIELFISLLLALQAGTVCELGRPVDWYEWIAAHPQAVRVGEIQFDDQFELTLIDGTPTIDGDGLVLFVFDMDNMPHGSCARLLDDPL